MTTKVEEIYLEAEADIRNSNYHDAFQKHESIIYEEPDFAPAHNSIGWLYKTQFDNYEKAERHFLTAMSSDPLYPHPYFHLASLYVDLERIIDLRKHLEKCMHVVTVDKAWVHYRYGMVSEMQGNYEEAIKNYQKAILHSFNNEKIKDYQMDMERCRTKLDIIELMKAEKADGDTAAADK
jgi:tetratricopeptide (TPR) repeat protein